MSHYQQQPNPGGHQAPQPYPHAYPPPPNGPYQQQPAPGPYPPQGPGPYPPQGPAPYQQQPPGAYPPPQAPAPVPPKHQVPFMARLIGVGIMLVTLIAAGIFAWQATYAAGLRGSHGEFTVSQCSTQTVSYRSHGKHRTREEVKCQGTFTADGGKGDDPNAFLEPASSHPAGSKISVTQTDSASTLESRQYSYVEANAWNAGLMFTFAFGMLIGTALGAFATVSGYTGTRSRVSFGTAWRSTAGGATRPILFGLAGVGALGVVVSLLLGLAL
ncbi:hypothetical protein ACOKM5_12560 [Streptomyces sp. BH097]|uniref:hypothetical protein n=1 Tax=unclassified Streptomyces TaxID=2593676 RepID=UPI003BB5AC4B